jgi:hypothetical protein
MLKGQTRGFAVRDPGMRLSWEALYAQDFRRGIFPIFKTHWLPFPQLQRISGNEFLPFLIRGARTAGLWS